ncbi:WD repeat-containing protein 89 [Vanessa cardui]|uniref:WD repeat-containing protein 89 n=1 Tax=Vanessa cardui TaxID=171605 RepID=UPI001F14134B|nr:WD repeat-containing protein 89 [Vanessa cardui]
MTDIIENEEIDKDTVTPEELDNLFSQKYNLLTETAVTLKKTYINKLSLTKSLNLAVSLLDNSIEVYKIEKSSISQVCKLSGHQKALTELVFSPKEDYLLYSAGHDGIKLWDTRTSGLCVQEYKEEEDTPARPYDAMDISCTGRVICAGSQLVQEDAYIVFWDQRNPQPLGGYWNSHTDDITQVKFHKEKTEILATGSLDGLLNVYNLMEETEDDALTYSMNVENSVEKITWLNENHVACITQSNDLQTWDAGTGDIIKTYNRDKIARSIKRHRSDDCYLVDAFTSTDNMVILAGSYGGDGTVLRSVTEMGKKLQPTTNFTKNKQVVRCCSYDDDHDLLVTAGESGLISVWNTDSGLEPVTITKKLKNQSLHDKRHKPY